MIYTRGWLDDKDYVLFGASALANAGLTTMTTDAITVFTKIKSVEGFWGIARFVYIEDDIDYTNFVTRGKTHPHILIPTKERALVESIKYIDKCDEGFLMEALDTYVNWNKEDVSKLEEVAEFYHVSKETVHYWINEMQEYIRSE